MSGGVDSSVTALLLHSAGYDVVGVTLRLYTDERTDAMGRANRCCGVEDVEDARRVCQVLGLKHYVINAEKEFDEHVINYFVSEYERGRTPHPCIACNDRIKFDFLLKRAFVWDAEYVATGHYARRTTDAHGASHILKAVDPRKDQSYVLFGLTQAQLAHTLLPVGDYTKDQIRAFARQAGLPVADKPDSQEICFIPTGDYRQFVAQRVTPKPGLIVDTDGKVIGQHQGIEAFTIGQRRGLGSAGGTPRYVIALHPEDALVVVGPEEALSQPSLTISRVNWLAGTQPAQPIQCTVKIRYKASEAPALVTPHGDTAEVQFEHPQRAVTPGQACVFYLGQELLGGGFIEAPRAAVTPLVIALAAR